MSQTVPTGTPTPLNKVTATLSRLTPMQKIAIGAALLTLIIGGVVLTRPGPGVPMAAVFSDLEPKAASAVMEELKSRGIAPELANGGSTVLVPQDRVYELRVDLSAQGIPNSSEGYSILDKQGITTSEFRQRIDLQRALEGELSRTLRSIEGVDAATVHLALPEESVFVDEPEEATASVLLRSSGARALTADQVAGMVNLVANAVKGLNPENVTITDGSGNVLAAGGKSGSAVGGDSRTNMTAKIESERAQQIRTLLAKVAGYENVAVTVRAELNLSSKETVRETFDPKTDDDGQQRVSREKVATETYEGGAEQSVQGGTGILGPDGVPTGEGNNANQGGDRTYSKRSSESNFLTDREVTTIKDSVGDVTRLHVAVLVNETVVTDEQLAEIERMAATAGGVNLERGDQVSVSRLPFDNSTEEAINKAEEADAAATTAEQRSSLMRTGIIGGVLLFALFLAYLSTRRARKEVATPIDIGALKAARLDDDDDDDGRRIAASDDDDETKALAAAAAASLEPPEPEIDPVAEASANALEELGALADRSPDDVAAILQGWLSDEGAGK